MTESSDTGKRPDEPPAGDAVSRVPPDDSAAGVIDLREEAAYLHARPQGAVRLTVEDIRERAYLLPPRHRRLVLVGGTDAQAATALEALRCAPPSATRRTSRAIRGARAYPRKPAHRRAIACGSPPRRSCAR